MMVRTLLHLVGMLAALGLLPMQAFASGSTPPVVLELFTSQGCSSCPAADRVLGKFAGDEDVISLSFHVDYWDYIGWKDTFASKETTARQHNYARAMGQRHVYTPQLVVGGQKHVVGSDERSVRTAIAALKKQGLTTATIKLRETGNRLKIKVSTDRNGPCEAWLFSFDRRHEVAVRRGENSGQKLAYFNVVREVQLLGRWGGGGRTFDITPDKLAMNKHDGYVIVVQGEGQGTVMAAARHWLK